MTVEITSLCSASGGEEIRVSFLVTGDGGAQKESFTVSARQYLILGISKGVCDTDTYDAVSEAAEVWRATKRGIYILSYGTCSEKALIFKLVAKGFDKGVAAKAAAELSSRGLIKAFDDAQREAQRQAAKLRGKRRIVSALYDKGYSAEAVNAAVAALDKAGIDYVENCRELIRKKYGTLPRDLAEKKKLIAALCRYGYSHSEIKAALARDEE